MAGFGTRALRPFIKGATCILATGCVALSLSGCVYSSTISEVIHVQDEQYDIDPDADPIYVNSVLAEMVSDQIPSLVPMTQGVVDYIEDMPTYDGDLSNAEIRESREGIDEFLNQLERSSRNGSNWEAGDGSQRDVEDESEGQRTSQRNQSDRSWLDGVASRTRDTTVTHVSSSQPSDGGNRADQGDATGNGSGSGDGTTGGGSSSAANAGGGQANGDANAGANGNDPNAASNVGRNPGSTFGDVGSIDDVPDGVRTVAAVGNAAIVCASLGGYDGDANLVAADAQLLGGNASYVLAGRSIGSAAAVWRGDGSVAGQLDMEALMQLAPDAVVVSEGEATLTEEEAAALNAAGTHVVYVPNMSSPERTELCVQRIGTMLGKGGDAPAKELADRYSDFMDSMRNYVQGDGVTYAVYVSEWETGAEYHGARTDVGVGGVAIAPAGGLSQPLGTYLRWAHVVNVASDKIRYAAVNAPAIVWPFRGGTNDPDWSGLANVNGGLWTDDNGFGLALTQIAPHNDAEVYFLGDDAFRYVIARTVGICGAILEDRGAGGVYSSAHDDTSISSDDYAVIVNPHGMFSSWASGSMESALEVPWAYKELLADGDDGGAFYECVAGFYDQFYGYPDADLGGIESGAYAG